MKTSTVPCPLFAPTVWIGVPTTSVDPLTPTAWPNWSYCAGTDETSRWRCSHANPDHPNTSTAPAPASMSTYTPVAPATTVLPSIATLAPSCS